MDYPIKVAYRLIETHGEQKLDLEQEEESVIDQVENLDNMKLVDEISEADVVVALEDSMRVLHDGEDGYTAHTDSVYLSEIFEDMFERVSFTKF